MKEVCLTVKEVRHHKRIVNMDDDTFAMLKDKDDVTLTISDYMWDSTIKDVSWVDGEIREVDTRGQNEVRR